MRIEHDDYRRGTRRHVNVDSSIRPAVLRDVHAIDAVHPIAVAKISSYDVSSGINLQFMAGGGRIHLSHSHGEESAWVADLLERLARDMPRAREMLAATEARPLVVQRCGAILAATFVDGARFRRDALSSRPLAYLWPKELRIESDRRHSDEPISIAITDYGSKERRVQVKASLPGIGVVDRTVSARERVELPTTVLVGLKGRRFDEVIAGTPFDGHDVRIEKLWTTGKGNGQRLSLMAQSDIIGLDEAVALIDRLRAPARMAA